MAALAGIGAMPDTIEDRAVVVRMRRRAPGEQVAPFRHRRDAPKLRRVAEALAEWLRANLGELERAEPIMPLEDRAADTWEPLIAVADLAGGSWPDRARRAAEVLNAERDGSAVASDRIRLLTDCRTAFAGAEAIPTTVLIDRLKADPEAPWIDYASTGLTPMRLAALLREYDIRSTTIRFAPPVGQAKGYYRADFVDAWNRYAPGPTGAVPDGSSQPSQPSPPSSAPVRPERRYGSGRTSREPVPGLSSTDTTGTAGTAARYMHLVGEDERPSAEGAG